MSNLREISKMNFEGKQTHEDITAGSLQRIADAAELMASNFVKLQNERDMYKRMWEDSNRRAESYRKSVSVYKGKYNGLKNKLKNQH